MADDNNVLNFVEKRKESIEKKRRSFERVMFQNILGVYTVIDSGGTVYPVSLVDISYDGCLLQTPWNDKQDTPFEKDKEITLRFYFTKSSFVPAIVKIKHTKEHQAEDGRNYMRYGSVFDKSISSFEALKCFIDFVYKFAEFSTTDHGENKVFFL
jgi:hypothetical protein